MSEEFSTPVSEVIASAIASQNQKAEEEEAQKSLGDSLKWFSNVDRTKISMTEFSYHVISTINNIFFDYGERVIVQSAMILFRQFVHQDTLKKYFEATRDEVVADFYLNVVCYFKGDASEPIVEDGSLMWDIKRALMTVMFFDENKAPSYARSLAKRFPKLLEGVSYDEPGFRGHLHRLALQDQKGLVGNGGEVFRRSKEDTSSSSQRKDNKSGPLTASIASIIQRQIGSDEDTISEAG